MNFYYRNYSNDTCLSEKKADWKEFGIKQLNKLMVHLGNSHGTIPSPSLVHYKEVHAGTKLIKQNEDGEYIYFLISGCVKGYCEFEGQETITDLLNDGNIFFNIPGHKHTNTIETLDRCRLLEIKRADFLELLSEENYYETMHIVFKIFKVKLDHCLILHSIKKASNKEKVKLLYKYYELMFHTFSIKQIALLAGMHPDTLSRERNKFFNQKALV